jgi:transcriptional regulator with XRE-family HTH domain
LENHTLSTRLRELRKSLGYSQEYVAIKLHTNITRISLIENDKTIPDANEIIMFSQIYNVDVRDILLEENAFNCDYHLQETKKIIDGFERLDSLLKENNSIMLKKWFFSIYSEMNDIMEEVKFLSVNEK